MPTPKHHWITPILTSVKKGVDKLWRIEKESSSMFQQKEVEKWPIRMNLGSIQEISRRADIAQNILKRAMQRKRKS